MSPVSCVTSGIRTHSRCSSSSRPRLGSEQAVIDAASRRKEERILTVSARYRPSVSEVGVLKGNYVASSRWTWRVGRVADAGCDEYPGQRDRGHQQVDQHRGERRAGGFAGGGRDQRAEQRLEERAPERIDHADDQRADQRAAHRADAADDHRPDTEAAAAQEAARVRGPPDLHQAAAEVDGEDVARVLGDRVRRDRPRAHPAAVAAVAPIAAPAIRPRKSRRFRTTVRGLVVVTSAPKLVPEMGRSSRRTRRPVAARTPIGAG